MTEILVEWESLVLIEEGWMRKRKEMYRSPVAKTSWISGGAEEYEGTIARKIWASLHDLVAASSRQLSSAKTHRLKRKGRPRRAMPKQRTITTSMTSRALHKTSSLPSRLASERHTASQLKCKEQPFHSVKLNYYTHVLYSTLYQF